MNRYEVLYILNTKSEEAVREAQIEKYKALVTSSGGTVEAVDKWGAKKLAYPIGFKSEGFYVLMNFTAAPDFPEELERQMRISDEVMRFIVVKK
ncbi:MAG: 30S ribosomal protein S6 [Clostridiales bacterium]|jgi:small subunit ribosomal protein S6|nr:30S ribosomal protein S6 [Clostridiales bacterium]